MTASARPRSGGRNGIAEAFRRLVVNDSSSCRVITAVSLGAVAKHLTRPHVALVLAAAAAPLSAASVLCSGRGNHLQLAG